MPWAAHGALVQQALGERPMIMRAGSTGGENLAAIARQQNLLAADVTEQHGALGEVIGSNAQRQVGAFRRVIRHDRVLTSRPHRRDVSTVKPTRIRGGFRFSCETRRACGWSPSTPSTYEPRAWSYIHGRPRRR